MTVKFLNEPACKTLRNNIKQTYIRRIQQAAGTRRLYNVAMTLHARWDEAYFHFLWDHWAHCGIFETGVLLMYTLEGVSSVANFITAYEESQ